MNGLDSSRSHFYRNYFPSLLPFHRRRWQFISRALLEGLKQVLRSLVRSLFIISCLELAYFFPFYAAGVTYSIYNASSSKAQSALVFVALKEKVIYCSRFARGVSFSLLERSES